MPNRYFIEISYNGAAYHGWQMQDNCVSVQSVLTNALSIILKEEIVVLGCGRTDTGVHAKQFFAHFDSINPDLTNDDAVFHLNSFLPPDIAVKRIIPVDANAHARFDATSRTYEYHIHTKKDTFINDYSYYIYGDVDVDLMNQAADLLFNYKDFSCFSKSGTQTKTNNCNITHAKWERMGDSIVFTITADRFLRNMVRAIVGTLINVGQHKITVKDFEDVIESKNRSNAGYSVPAKGLYLTSVVYPYI